MTPADMMRHAVGWLRRNYYCVPTDEPEFSQWTGLVILGLAKPGKLINDGRDQYFHVTTAGLEYLIKMESERDNE